jgi:hypothetical protein
METAAQVLLPAALAAAHAQLLQVGWQCHCAQHRLRCAPAAVQEQREAANCCDESAKKSLFWLFARLAAWVLQPAAALLLFGIPC